MNSKEWGDIIAKTIKDYDLYGSSFTRGVALYMLVMNGRSSDEYDTIKDTIEEWTGKEYNTMRGAVEDTDLAVLAELADYLSGEVEE